MDKKNPGLKVMVKDYAFNVMLQQLSKRNNTKRIGGMFESSFIMNLFQNMHLTLMVTLKLFVTPPRLTVQSSYNA